MIIVADGTGQFANLVCEAASLTGISVFGFVSPEWNSNNINLSCPRLSLPAAQSAASEGIEFVAAAGSNSMRRQCAALVIRWGGKLKSVIHPAATVSPSAEIGSGTVLLAGAIVGPKSKLGRSTIINHAASVDHNCIVSDFVSLSPGARLGGSVRASSGVAVGMNACVLQGLSLGENSTVGAGAVVIADVEAEKTVAGVPARVIRG